jgi:hypothetical protein
MVVNNINMSYYKIHMAPKMQLVNYIWISDLKVVAIKMACEAAATV